MTDSTTTTETTNQTAEGDGMTVLDLRPASVSVERELLRLGLTYSNDYGDEKVWVDRDRSRGITATIPDKDSTTVTITDTTTGESRSLDVDTLSKTSRIITVADGLD